MRYLVVILTFLIPGSLLASECDDNVLFYQKGATVECDRLGYSIPYDKAVRLKLTEARFLKDRVLLLEEKLEIRQEKITTLTDMYELQKERTELWQKDAMAQSALIKTYTSASFIRDIKIFGAGVGVGLVVTAVLIIVGG